MIHDKEWLVDALFKKFPGTDDYSSVGQLGLLFDPCDTSNKVKIDDTYKSLWSSVDPNNKVPIPPDFNDLARLHFLVRSRKVTTILEFGVGKSTVIFNDALTQNHLDYGEYAANNLRRSDLFKCFSVDSYQDWVDEVKLNTDISRVEFTVSHVEVGTFQERICTFYSNLPNVCPDLIYLDGPDQFSSINDVRGISTRHPDRMPMAADILAIEHFLLPGTLIVVDGRSANVRFLKANLQRCWVYGYDQSIDQHYFELTESPLGRINEEQLRFCLGSEFFKRLQNI